MARNNDETLPVPAQRAGGSLPAAGPIERASAEVSDRQDSKVVSDDPIQNLVWESPDQPPAQATPGLSAGPWIGHHRSHGALDGLNKGQAEVGALLLVIGCRVVQFSLRQFMEEDAHSYRSRARASRNTCAADFARFGCRCNSASLRPASSSHRRSFSASLSVSRLSSKRLASRARSEGPSLSTWASNWETVMSGSVPHLPRVRTPASPPVPAHFNQPRRVGTHG
jgi:hypothetical protein